MAANLSYLMHTCFNASPKRVRRKSNPNFKDSDADAVWSRQGTQYSDRSLNSLFHCFEIEAKRNYFVD
ncbi:unnamed protein product [Sphenostylis stenocarpa]|uniref:Uncharacterized protein n=1 Tax=Sphenostylis stenocarpa TaxID=92480 RepID=A0AA86S2A5_9FABA|nr:unnamed protein product [Sphenostylis stenocarpa]